MKKQQPESQVRPVVQSIDPRKLSAVTGGGGPTSDLPRKQS